MQPADYYRGVYHPDPRTRPTRRAPDTPLTVAEWQQLQATLRRSDLVVLIDRLAAYHGVTAEADREDPWYSVQRVTVFFRIEHHNLPDRATTIRKKHETYRCVEVSYR